LEEIENRQNLVNKQEQHYESYEEPPTTTKLMDRKELDEFQNKILNEINELENKKHVEYEEPLREVKGRVVPKNVNLDLPPSVEKAYKEYKQKKNNGAPENPFNEDNGSSKKNNSWTNNFKYNHTSPDIPSSIKELLDKKPTSSPDRYIATPELKEVIKGKKENDNHHFFSGNPSSIPDPKEVIKGKKKNPL
jgi:hypothetical protein